jgi:hypothetical protein
MECSFELSNDQESSGEKQLRKPLCKLLNLTQELTKGYTTNSQHSHLNKSASFLEMQTRINDSIVSEIERQAQQL